MEHVFLARQPIFDRARSVAGYELLYRGGIAPRAVVDQAETATARVALGALTEMGFDQLVGDHVVWINVTREFMLQGLVNSLPAKRVVLELLEHQLVDQKLIGKISELRDAGYRFALDDFTDGPGTEELLPLVEFVKLDLVSLGADGPAREAERLKPHGLTLVAEKGRDPRGVRAQPRSRL